MTVEDTEQVAAHEREEQDLSDGEHYDALRTTAMDIAGGLMEEGVCAEARRPLKRNPRRKYVETKVANPDMMITRA